VSEVGCYCCTYRSRPIRAVFSLAVDTVIRPSARIRCHFWRQLARAWYYCRGACAKNGARNNSSRVAIGNWIGAPRATCIYVLSIFMCTSGHACSCAASQAVARKTKKINSVQATSSRSRNKITRSRSQNDAKLMDARSPTTFPPIVDERWRFGDKCTRGPSRDLITCHVIAVARCLINAKCRRVCVSGLRVICLFLCAYGRVYTQICSVIRTLQRTLSVSASSLCCTK